MGKAMSNRMKKMFFVVCFMLMTAIMGQTQVYALTASGNVSDGTSVKITAHTVVDSITYNGVKVDAVYKPKNGDLSYNYDSTYCCAAFVQKFYKQVYGVTVGNLIPTCTPSVRAGGGSFSKTTTPKVGDIYGNYTHWAIVKKVSGNNITLIEQNYWWNSTTNIAGKERIVPLSSSNHWFFTWSGATSAVSNVAVSSVSLNKTSATLAPGKTVQLSASVSPSNATNKTISWTTSDSAVASVNSSGLVTAKKPGTATITAKSSNGKTAACKITVTFNATVTTAAYNQNSGIYLKFTNVNDESGYRIYRRAAGESYKLLATTKANVVTYLDKTAKAGTTYAYLVRPYRGSYLGAGQARTMVRLTTPSIYTVKNTSSKKATVTVNKVTGATEYLITYQTGSTTKSVKISASKMTTVSGRYAYTLSGLTKGKTYSIKVTAYKGNYKSYTSTAKSVNITK